MKKIFILTFTILQNTFNETEQHLPAEDTHTNSTETVTTDRKEIIEKIINKYIKTGCCSQNHIKNLAFAIDSAYRDNIDVSTFEEEIEKLNENDKQILENIIKDPEYHEPIGKFLSNNPTNQNVRHHYIFYSTAEKKTFQFAYKYNDKSQIVITDIVIKDDI
jgi:hypothetical protein